MFASRSLLALLFVVSLACGRPEDAALDAPATNYENQPAKIEIKASVSACPTDNQQQNPKTVNKACLKAKTLK